MNITSALPGLWAGGIAAATLAGVTIYRQPAAQGPLPAKLERVTSAPVITALFNERGVAGHLTLTLTYRLEGDKTPVATLEEQASDRLVQAALEQADTFASRLADPGMIRQFVHEHLVALEGYTDLTVEEAQFYPFANAAHAANLQ